MIDQSHMDSYGRTSLEMGCYSENKAALIGVDMASVGSTQYTIFHYVAEAQMAVR